MCGITGVFALNDAGKKYISNIENSVKTLKKRGPDGDGLFTSENVALGHARLSIIDISDAAAQPFTDDEGRYTIVFNGEIFNFKELKSELITDGIKFNSTSDTEVLLYLYIKYKEKCINLLNGFFAFAIYDSKLNSLFLARDRFGIKPLLLYRSADVLLFASEMKALLAYGIAKSINFEILATYLHLNYVPGNHAILNQVEKLAPASWMEIDQKQAKQACYYEIKTKLDTQISYQEACKKLYKLLDESVTRRLISDVPLGSFLSGGIDSSAVSALAAMKVDRLNTFSIGYADEPLFDETNYALEVAKKYNTNHTVFKLKNEDLFEHLDDVLDYIDEPFADSSALAVFILSKETRKHVTVALSGDGADELFAGYNKHLAEYKIRQFEYLKPFFKLASPILEILPQSRNSKIGNKIRQVNKFAQGGTLSPKERYWKWCGYSDEKYLKESLIQKIDYKHFQKIKKELLKHIDPQGGINDMLLADVNLVLPGDMLTKVDLMSMANSLEVRVPFLDYNIVDFAFSLPSDFKVNKNGRKLIVQDAFRSILPASLYHRPKHGFEVPLLKWFRTSLNHRIFNEYLAKDFLREQGIFSENIGVSLRNQLHSNNPGDVAAKIWALIVFQHWWKKWFK